MKPWSYKAVITDIDGTLVQYRPDLSNLSEADSFVPKSTIQAVKKLHEMGMKVSSVTGRTYEQSKDILIKLGISGPCVFAGGATIRVIPSGEILFEASLTSELVAESLNVLHEVLGDDYPIELAPAAKNVGMINSLWVRPPKEMVEKILNKLARIDGIYYIVNEGSGNEIQSGLAILSNEANKGSGTRQLLSLLNVKREETACIGDGANDVLMFGECGLSIAMGNGEDILKMAADHVVADIDKDGFSEAIEYILNVN